MRSKLSKEKICLVDWIEANKADFYRLSDAIWSYAELGMEEYRSSGAIVKFMKGWGIKVETGVAKMPTAFVATIGSGKPVIGLSCEYDALPGLSQQKGVSQKSPVIEGAPGHGCGHNILGVAPITAALALREVMQQFGLPGTIKIFGTPAEELCLGKPFMARADLFRGVDAFLDWHPAEANTVKRGTCKAYFNVKYHFKGRAAHGSTPWFGRSALDAATLTGYMIELLREHITPGNGLSMPNTINYSFPDVGPFFPNVVPDRATIWCVVRITTSEELSYVVGRLDKCAEAAAMATETTVEVEKITATHQRIPNRTISQVLYDNLQAIGAPQFTLEEHEFARQLQRSVGAPESGINSNVAPFDDSGGSVSDNSEYSWFAPFGFLLVAHVPSGVPYHTWQVNACAGSSIAKKTMDVAAKVIGMAAIDLLMLPETIAEAMKEFHERLGGKSYQSLIPETVDPPVLISRETMDKYRPLQEQYYIGEDNNG